MEDYKEKYNKLVESIKVLQETNPSDEGIQNWVNDNVPELKESEDERMLREIKRYIKEQGDKPTGLPNGTIAVSDMIAWLEKQGKSSDQIHYWTEEEIELIINDYLRGAEHYGGMIGRLRCLKPKSLEKQNEKPATINVDKMVEEFEDFKVMAGRIPSLAEIDAYRKGVNDVLSKVLIKEEKPITIGSKKAEGKLGEMLAASKKPAGSGEDKELTHSQVTKKSDKVWNEDDEKNLQGVIDEIQANKSNAPEYDLKTYDKFLSWLKSIKDRVQPQPKQEWGKEDEMSWKNAIEVAVSYFGLPSETVNWLKSIKQRLS